MLTPGPDSVFFYRFRLCCSFGEARRITWFTLKDPDGVFFYRFRPCCLFGHLVRVTLHKQPEQDRHFRSRSTGVAPVVQGSVSPAQQFSFSSWKGRLLDRARFLY